MKVRLLLTAPLFAMALALASCSILSPTKQVQVTNQTMAAQPAGKPYVIDLTRGGTTYDVAAGIDASRVRVRTSSNEEIAMSEFLGRRNVKPGERVLLGSLSELVDVLPPDDGGSGAGGSGVSEASCDKQANSCYCNGRKDCSDLSKSGKCKPGPGDATCGQGHGGGTGFGCSCQMK
jgi:hypothetical protein